MLTTPVRTSSATETQPTWSPRKVILFTYHRSGSSFTADIIHHSPNVFYVYEPLRALMRQRFVVEAEINNSNTYLNELLSCKLSSSYLLKISGFLKLTPETQMIWECYKSTPFGASKTAQRGRNNTSKSEALQQRNLCIKKAEAVCRRHKVTMVKVIRYNMDAARQMMDLNPDLAVIYLVRDPRASIRSRMLLFKRPSIPGLPAFAADLCGVMLQHMQKAQVLYNDNPHRLRFLRYEELAGAPVHVLRNILRFLQLKWSKSIEAQTILQTDREGAKRLNLTQNKSTGRHNRKDSSRMTDAWRKSVPWYVVDTIQKTTECQQVMQLAGYETLNTEADLRNMTVPSRREFELVKMLKFAGGDLGV